MKVVIGGLDVSLYVEAVSIDDRANERATATVVLEGDAGVPDEDDEVAIYGPDGVTVVFGGLVREISERGWRPHTDAVFIDVEVDSWERVCDWCSVSLKYDEATALEDIWEDIVTDVLGPNYGITYSKVATGVTIEPFAVTDVTVTDVLRQLRANGKQLIRFLADKSTVIEAWGGSAAPMALTSANRRLFEFVTRGTQARQRANRVKGIFGPTGQFVTTQRWTLDGVATSWEVDIPAARGGWHRGLIAEYNSSGVFQADRTVSPPGGGGYYEWDDTDGRGTIAEGTGTAPSSGFLEWVYTGVFPFTVAAGNGTPLREMRVRNEAIGQYPLAVQFVSQLLASVDRASARTVSAATVFGDTWSAGQGWHVDLSERDAPAATYLIRSVNATCIKGSVWRYRIEATEGSEPQRSVNDELRALFGGGSAGSVPVLNIAPGGGSGGIAGLAWVYLGGSLATAVQIASAGTYVSVADAVDFVAPATGTMRLRAKIRAAVGGVTVKARLIHVGGSGHSAESSGVTGTTAGEVTVVTAVTAGERYRLSVTTDTNGAWAFGLGSLEAI